MSLKINDKVRIKKTSKFFSEEGKYGMGKVIEIGETSIGGETFKYTVKFEGFGEYNYNDRDLALITNINDRINRRDK